MWRWSKRLFSIKNCKCWYLNPYLGLSLSLLDSSIAAPFSSSNNEISSLVDLLKEGKASLDTSYRCFKFMMLYSIIQFISQIILLNFATSLSNNQFIVSDLLIVFPMSYFISRYHLIKKGLKQITN